VIHNCLHDVWCNAEPFVHHCDHGPSEVVQGPGRHRQQAEIGARKLEDLVQLTLCRRNGGSPGRGSSCRCRLATRS
jgi:hypothetical protein